eukprot:TRINITY_DN9900_c0_g1_i1.p1 TRINITY_DN9900_c0_g1~~TRINITY_DN9900_c0_g1_i1.p1  ORF type:complete len:103 (+),score=22.23 TRINITY_DN9900_c0_g1_i1:156-464(+)
MTVNVVWEYKLPLDILKASREDTESESSFSRVAAVVEDLGDDFCFCKTAGFIDRLDSGNTIMQFPSCSNADKRYTWTAEINGNGELVNLIRQRKSEEVKTDM